MQFFASLFVLLSVFQFAMATTEKLPAAVVVARQATTTTGAMVDPCMDYSMTANMSVISANSSYRTAFIQKAPVGTIITSRMLDAAQARLPSLTMNAALNSQCGNLTTVAITEAANNFTKGIVAQFTTEGLPVGIKAGIEVIFVCIACCIILCVTWVFAS